ncbi:MAG TPA: ABC transporter permease [Mycobacteriales bacterium]|nr:ABC transporter permease [Mycobacteriales bacterium]
MWTVTLADLRMRARQFAVAVLGATLVFAMALIMAGLAGSFDAEARRTVASVGADSYVVGSGVGGPFTSPAALPGRMLATIRHEPGVLQADPLVVQPSLAVSTPTGKQFVHLIGVRPDGLGAPHVGTGRPLAGAGQAVVDDITKLSVGQTFSIGPHRFTVVGTVHGLDYLAGVPIVFLTLHDAQQAALGGHRDMTAVAVRGIPQSVPHGLTVMSADQARQDILVPLQQAKGSISTIRNFLFCVAVVIIAVVVYLSALERRRDFAVLKAIGSSTRWLYGGMAVQAATIALLSGLLALAIEPLMAAGIPMQLAVPGSARAALPVLALAIGLLASLAGLRQAVRADPALAFGSA